MSFKIKIASSILFAAACSAWTVPPYIDESKEVSVETYDQVINSIQHHPNDSKLKSLALALYSDEIIQAKEFENYAEYFAQMHGGFDTDAEKKTR